MTTSSRRTSLIILLTTLIVAYLLWSPGESVTDGRHDRGRNAVWLSHGWLGADSWFERHDRDSAAFRDSMAVARLAWQLQRHHVTDAYPHLAPTTAAGHLPPHDPLQTERFLDQTPDLRVLPWVGGVLGEHVFLGSPSWRRTFTADVARLLEDHPRMAGIHLNVEPLPSGSDAYLALLEELRQALPPDKLLSVAAYPPPLIWQPGLDVHWNRAYYQKVAHHADQIVVMMYDTALPLRKPYVSFVARWTADVLIWLPETDVLLGLPAYEDLALYHWPWAETLHSGLRGAHAGLERFEQPPDSYQGIAIYSHWTMSEPEWTLLDRHFVE
jgi:hypothetical protein